MSSLTRQILVRADCQSHEPSTSCYFSFTATAMHLPQLLFQGSGSLLASHNPTTNRMNFLTDKGVSAMTGFIYETWCQKQLFLFPSIII